MTTIEEIRFSLVWCQLVPETLGPEFGALISGAGFRAAVENDVPNALTDVPWSGTGAAKWSRFWSSYLRQPRRIRGLSADAAWDYLVPFALVGGERPFEGPSPADAVDFEVWLFPHAVAVIATVSATGAWTPAAAAAVAAELRHSGDYIHHGHRTASLDSLASDLADLGVAMLAPGAAQVGVSNPISVAAGIAASGTVDDLDLSRSDVASCVAGLATLGGKGTLKPAHLFDVNTDARRGGRVYWEKQGHVIWNADAMIELPDRPRCAQQNHTHLIAQIAALSALVKWAADEVQANRPVPVETHALLARAMCRLAQLDEGDQNKTYRAGIAAQRIEPVRAAMKAVRDAGLPSGL